MVEYKTFALAYADELRVGDKLPASEVTVSRIATDIDADTAGAGRTLAISYRMPTGETYVIPCRKDDAVAIAIRADDFDGRATQF